MKNSTNTFSNIICKLNSLDYLNNQRIAGKILADLLYLLKEKSQSGKITNLLELDKIAENFINSHLHASCTFKGYKNFPNAVCISINNQLVHSIPSNYDLKDGDIVTFDTGVTYKGSIADSAITVPIGNVKLIYLNMIKTAEECLDKAISNIVIGKKIGIIGETIYKTAKNAGYNIISDYGGHGIGNTVHEQPFISNKSTAIEGIRFQSGMSIAIEPLLVPATCSTETFIGKDGWTVYSKDISCHVEKTIFITDNKVEVITDWKS